MQATLQDAIEQAEAARDQAGQVVAEIRELRAEAESAPKLAEAREELIRAEVDARLGKLGQEELEQRREALGAAEGRGLVDQVIGELWRRLDPAALVDVAGRVAAAIAQHAEAERAALVEELREVLAPFVPRLGAVRALAGDGAAGGIDAAFRALGLDVKPALPPEVVQLRGIHRELVALAAGARLFGSDAGEGDLVKELLGIAEQSGSEELLAIVTDPHSSPPPKLLRARQWVAREAVDQQTAERP